jgi:hypothetical protein
MQGWLRALPVHNRTSASETRAMTPVLAHLGHWYEVTPYVGPVVLIAAWVMFQSFRYNGEEDE